MTKTKSQKRRAAAARRAAANAFRGIRTKTNARFTRNRSRAASRRRSARVGARRSRLGGSQPLSPCAKKYLEVLENPFSGQTACVPSLLNFPSMKHSVFARGNMSTGSVGTGFVMVQPWLGFFSSPLTTPSPASIVNAFVTFTQADFNGNSFAIQNNGDAPVGGVMVQSSNTPYSPSLPETAFRGRLVACGLRVRQVTSLLNRGGTMVGLEEPNHLSINGQRLSDAALYEQADFQGTGDDNWHSVVYHPQEPDELEWYDSTEILDAVSGNESGIVDSFFLPILGFIINAPPASSGSGVAPQTFEWEAHCVFEAKGTAVAGQKPSASDPLGMATVQNLTASVSARKPKTGERFSWVNTLLTAAGTFAGSYANARYGAGGSNFRGLAPNTQPLIELVE